MCIRSVTKRTIIEVKVVKTVETVLSYDDILQALGSRILLHPAVPSTLTCLEWIWSRSDNKTCTIQHNLIQNVPTKPFLHIPR